MISKSAVVVGRVAVVVLIPVIICVKLVVPVPFHREPPQTSQSPAVREILVMLAGVAVVSEIAPAELMLLDMNSPILPAVALPPAVVPTIFGVVIVGLVVQTIELEPVTAEVIAVATPVPSPLTPVVIGNPVQLVRVPEAGVPRAGVTKVGEVAKTRLPEPVSSVTVVLRLAEVGVVKKVDTPVAIPVTLEIAGVIVD